MFPGTKDRAHLVGLQKIWPRLRNRAEVPDVRLHDLRHSFASVGAAGGDSLLIIGRLLGHRNAASTQRYAHLGDDPLRSAANRISQQIAAAMSGQQKIRGTFITMLERAGGENIRFAGCAETSVQEPQKRLARYRQHLRARPCRIPLRRSGVPVAKKPTDYEQAIAAGRAHAGEGMP